VSFSLLSPCTPAYQPIQAITHIHTISSSTNFATSHAIIQPKAARIKLASSCIVVFFFSLSIIIICIQFAIAPKRMMVATQKYDSMCFSMLGFSYNRSLRFKINLKSFALE
jgi:hypothetical protein